MQRTVDALHARGALGGIELNPFRKPSLLWQAYHPTIPHIVNGFAAWLCVGAAARGGTAAPSPAARAAVQPACQVCAFGARFRCICGRANYCRWVEGCLQSRDGAWLLLWGCAAADDGLASMP